MNKLLTTLFLMACLVPDQWSSAQSYENGALVQLVSGQVFEGNGQRFGGVFGIDAGYVSGLEKTKDWTRILNAKEVVWTFHWRDMADLKNSNDSIQNFGNVIGVSMSSSFELWKTGVVQFDFAPAIGLSYFSKTSIMEYDGLVGIGSRLDDLVSAGINAEAAINSKMSLVAGFNFMHFSNAGFQNPNGGINSWNIKLGIKPRFKPKSRGSDTSLFQPKPAFKHPEGSSFEFYAGAGRRGVDSSRSGFFRSGLYGGYNYYVNQVLGLKAGLDVVYYRSVFDPDHYSQTFQGVATSYDHFSAGISIGADIAMNKLVITYQLGKYLHFRGPSPLTWYWKGGFRYYFTPGFGICSTVYLNAFNADFINWGIVLRFK